MPQVHDVLALILGGGAGTRLYPLTKMRSKPAVPLAGKYRLIDIPISNCMNSGIEHIYVLTQYNSVSLHRHIYQTYKFDVFSPGWVQVLAAEQTATSTDWYQGTADAVRKQLVEIRSFGARDTLILSGDHLYRMDYSAFLRTHRDNQADITVAVKPVSRGDAGRFGLLKTDTDGRIVAFAEKPKDPAVVEDFATGENPDLPCMASMGIYVFRTELLMDLLRNNDGPDFGYHILPAAIEQLKVQSHAFHGYWEDIGTIRSFYEANLALVRRNPPFDFYDAINPIYSHPRFLPGTRLGGDCVINRVLIADGCYVVRSRIDESVIGLRSRIGPNATLTRSIVMGADYYETEADKAENRRLGRPEIGIAADCVIEGAIIDKNARIGEGVVIRSIPDRPDEETDLYVARDGLIIIPKSAVIPAGTVI